MIGPTRQTGAAAGMVVACLAAAAGVVAGAWMGYRDGHADARAAIRAAEARADVAVAELASVAATRDACNEANLTMAIAIEGLAVREDGCARFLTLDAWSTYRLSHAGKGRKAGPEKPLEPGHDPGTPPGVGPGSTPVPPR